MMNGARKYAELIPTGQYGSLYIVSGMHARGRTFYVYVLPDGEEATPNGPNNPPLNSDAVEVYGVVAGNPGWTEEYGWKHKGPWQDDLERLAESFRLEREAKERQHEAECEGTAQSRREMEKTILANYNPLPAES